MLRQAGALICLAGLLAGLAALAVGRLAPLRIDFDVVNHFIPHLLILIVACLLGLLVARHSLATAVAIVLLGVIGIGLWPHVASRPGAVSVATGEGWRSVRVMAFNTRHESENWRAVADEVVRHDPDIVVLLEINRANLPIFEALGSVWPHRADCLDEDYCQNVILSKFALSSSETRSQWEGPQMVQVKYGPELGGLTVVGAHTLRFPYSARQLEQMQALGDVLAQQSGPLIVAGDFNATPPSFMLNALLERGGLELVSRLPTWPATLGLPQIAIDHIMVGQGLRPLGPARIGAAAGSDHYPVIADIAVPLSD